MSTTILAIGCMIFVSHFLSLQFRKTNVPDVLLLMVIGLVLGPVLGWVDASDFGKIGPVTATIALVVILFESGTSLDLRVMGRALAPTTQLTFGCFVLTALIVSLVAFFALKLALAPAILLGIILAGTSSAVVIPMVESLGLAERPATVLILESALTDVLCIVGVFALLQIITQGQVEPGKLAGDVLSALLFAAALGLLGGIGWLLVLGKIRGFPNTISSTLAFAFIVYGVSEALGFSGAIAALSLGITLNNFETLGLKRIKVLDNNVVALTAIDTAFYREAVFLLKTYFFVYLGISIQFSGWTLVFVALGMMALVFATRTALTRYVYRSKDYSLRDAAMTSILAPKGLAAAVLASMPLRQGVSGGELIRDTTYMVILVSISLCAFLIIIYPTPLVKRCYALLLGKPLDVAAPDAAGAKRP